MHNFGVGAKHASPHPLLLSQSVVIVGKITNNEISSIAFSYTVTPIAGTLS